MIPPIINPKITPLNRDAMASSMNESIEKRTIYAVQIKKRRKIAEDIFRYKDVLFFLFGGRPRLSFFVI